MPIYKQITEITNIDDLLSSIERDIEEVYFGDKQVFTVWAEYDGTLPAQYTANGDYLADYRVYGAAGGVGDKTVNLWVLDTSRRGYYDNAGNFVASNAYYCSEMARIDGATALCQSFVSSVEQPFYNQLTFFDENQIFIEISRITQSGQGKLTAVHTPPANAVYAIGSILRYGDDYMFTEGSTAPAEYVPYGYEVDMSVKSINPVPPTSTWADGYYANDGSIVTASAVSQEKCCLDYIPITAQTHYVFSASGGFPSGTSGAWRGYAFYDENKNFISRYANTGEGGYDVYVLANVAYCRLTMRTYGETFDTMLNEGSTPLPYQPYSNTTTPIYIGTDPLEEDEYISYSEQKIYRKNPANYFDGYFELGAIDYNTGAEISTGSSIRTDFIELEPSNRYYIKWKTGNLYILVISYDENKNYAKYLGAKSQNPSFFDLNANEKYIRFYLYNTTTPPKEMMVCKNANAPYLQPTDPPVPLPALPTVGGTNIVDYAGQSVAPSRFYAKYRKQNF